MSKDGQGTKCRRNIAKNFNWLSRVHERYRRQTTGGRATAYSERVELHTLSEREHELIDFDMMHQLRYDQFLGRRD